MSRRSPGAVPRATYRVQLNAAFTFDHAVSVLPYLRDLGVSHLYVSPVLQAAPGSTHGYDVVDHSRVSRELGGEDGFIRLTDALAAAGMGLVLDIVPNHMWIGGEENRWWWDVLEHGRRSRFARYFDLDLDVDKPILLPVLPDRYERVLATGSLRLERDGPRFVLVHAGRRFPIDARTTTLLAEDKAAVARVNTDRDVLDRLLQRQNYRLAWWRCAADELGYRRFLDINELIGLRVEDPDVFAATHARVTEWVATGRVQGLRVDHPDGLRDPAAYFARLRAACGDAWIVAEKILQGDEEPPPEWLIDGTTGYGFANVATAVLVDPAGRGALDEMWHERADVGPAWEQIQAGARVEAIERLLGSDANRLTDRFAAVCSVGPRGSALDRGLLRQVLVEVMAAMEVYRTYVGPAPGVAAERDVDIIRRALATASARRPELDRRAFELLGEVLLLEIPGRAARELALGVQQLTPAAMVKGVEDTAFYRHHRLTALNEVGGEPDRFGLDADAFHRTMAAQQERWPAAMLALSTHDSKRSADVRARLATLSEDADAWRVTVSRLADIASRHRSADRPSRADEYLMFQTLVGAWPIGEDRLVAYLLKASREAKLHTSWTEPDAAYEGALGMFARDCLRDEAFVGVLSGFVNRVIEAGRVASLAQVTLQLTAPGVPDLYQGSELWKLNLVDPDNRRPIDFAERRRLLADVADLSPADAWARADEGMPKLWLIHRGLELRRRRPAAFGRAASYKPLGFSGRRADGAIAFTRGAAVLVVVPTRAWQVTTEGWLNTSLALPHGTWRAIDGSEWAGSVPLSELLPSFPVGILERV